MGKAPPSQQNAQQQRLGCNPFLLGFLVALFLFLAGFSALHFVNSLQGIHTPLDVVNLGLNLTILILSIFGVVGTYLQWLVPYKLAYKGFQLAFKWIKSIHLFTSPERQDMDVPVERKFPNVPPRHHLMYFTGHQEFLKNLEDAFRRGQRAQTIGGIRGIGKSVIALKYAYDGNYQTVLWIALKDLQASCKAINAKLHEQEADASNNASTDPQLEVESVIKWLEDHENWLLVLDGCNAQEDVQRFIRLEKGHILVTTDLSGIAGTHYTKLPLIELDEAALMLLRRCQKLKGDEPIDEAKKEHLAAARQIAHAHGRLPLALAHAGDYIRQQCPLEDFLDIYQEHPRVFFEHNPGSAFIDEDHNTIKNTWVNKRYPWFWYRTPFEDAAKLFKFCAFFGPAAIPENLLTEAPELDITLNKALENKETRYRTIEKLSKFSLIDCDQDKKTLSLQPVLRDIIRAGIYGDSEQALRPWAEHAVRSVHAQLIKHPNQSTDEDEAIWQLCHDYLPHAHACCHEIAKYDFKFPEAMQLLYIIGRFKLACGQYDEAKELLTRSCSMQQNVSDGRYPGLATRKMTLGELYHLQGKLAEARKVYQDAWDNGKPSEKEKTIIDVHLGQVNDDLGNDEEAASHYNKALTNSKAIFGERHFRVAIVQNNLASLYMKKGRPYDNAQEQYLQAFRTFKASLGSNHPHTLECKANLATLFILQGKITKTVNMVPLDESKDGEMLDAKECYKDTLKIGIKSLGRNRPQIAERHNDLAELYYMQENFSEARAEYLQALEIYETLGLEHPRRAIIMRNYVELLKRIDQDGSTYGEMRDQQHQAEKILDTYAQTAAVQSNANSQNSLQKQSVQITS